MTLAEDGRAFSKVRHPLGFYQVAPTPDDAWLKDYYDRVYYQELTSSTYQKEYGADELEYIHNRSRISESLWRRETGGEAGRLMDVGCGEGFFMKHFVQRGWEVAGCDYSDHGLKTQNPDLEPFFVKGDVYDILTTHRDRKTTFDLVNLSNVLEHVVDPAGLLTSIAGIMHPRSVLRIQVPNDYSAFQAMLVEKGFSTETWFVPPDHLNYFTFASLAALLESTGYHVVAQLADFPIELFLCNQHSNYCFDRSKGPEAHKARVLVDNFLVAQGWEAYVEYASAAAKCGYGRSIEAFASLAAPR
jgi:2-polyprenyl-3-methyl-5-hydroxy-6-metoxy-1,4-benzoquinol methylase